MRPLEFKGIKMKKIILSTLLVGLSLYAGPTLTPEVKDLLKSAKENVSSVNAADLTSMIEKESVILIDVRDPNEWKKGAIDTKRLVQISRGFLEIKYPKLILKKYNKDDNFVVYCAIEPRSVLAASRLKELGFTNVSYLKGGFKNWSKLGYKTTPKIK